MNRKQLINIYQNFQGKLEKKSTNFFLGYQEKDWKILQNGTKIAYKNPNQTQFALEKTYKLTDIHTEQVDEEHVFLLHAPNRVYQLRADNQELRKDWMRAITVLKKQIRRKAKQQKIAKSINIVSNHNDSTLPSIDPFNQLNMTNSFLHQTLPPRFTNVTNSKLSSEFYVSKSMIEDELKEKFQEYLKKMGPSYVHYHVFVSKLTTKSKQLFLTSAFSHYYILFSSKSLIPDEFISEENLTSAHLPHWADPDGFFRLSEDTNNCKLMFQLNKIQEIIEADSTSSLKIVTPEDTYEFFCDSLVAVKKLKEALEIGRINALESLSSNGSKKNYDHLILLHTSNLQQFNYKVYQMITPFIPTKHSYQPQVVKTLIDNLSPFIIEVLEILQSKVSIPTNTIIDFLRIIHQQVRRHLKITWDSSYSRAKGGDILNILKSVSRYENLVNKYVKDLELDDALKELSKSYMRICYKNFQTIILGLVNQERKDNYFIEEEEGEEPFHQTHGITDLFKLVYDVFDLAIPCWNNKLHLHNINRLIKRALSVFIRQLKSTIDEEEDISTSELIAISNNYIKFNEEVEEFYQSKLSELKEQTKESYDQLRNDYRQISMIVIDKIVLPLKIQLKIYFEKQGFYTASMEDAYKKIVESGIVGHVKNVHFIFKKRYFERIFATLKEQICKMLEKEAKKVTKKKPQQTKILQRLEIYKKDCTDIADLLTNTKMKITKEFQQIKTLITSNKREEIKMILSESSQFYKRIYKNILFFRTDYSEGTSLHAYISSLENEQPYRDLKLPEDPDRRRSSFSKYYIQQFDRNSITSSLQKDRSTERERSENGQEKLKMISQGYVRRTKNQTGYYEQIYLKIKKSILYIYENERMERCQNTIQIQDINEIKIPSYDKPNFVIVFSALNRTKEMRIKCQNLEDCNRWVYSLQLQLRRINNDKKLKSKGIKIKEKKSKLIIDYDELMSGTDYFSYNL